MILYLAVSVCGVWGVISIYPVPTFLSVSENILIVSTSCFEVV